MGYYLAVGSTNFLNIREWTGLESAKFQRAVENREKWKKLFAKSPVVPQQPLQLRDGWDERWNESGLPYHHKEVSLSAVQYLTHRIFGPTFDDDGHNDYDDKNNHTIENLWSEYLVKLHKAVFSNTFWERLRTNHTYSPQWHSASSNQPTCGIYNLAVGSTTSSQRRRSTQKCRPRGLTFTRWGCCDYVFDINHPSLPTPFHSVLVFISVFMAISTVFHSINSTDNSPLSLSVFPVLFLPYWSFQLYIS